MWSRTLPGCNRREKFRLRESRCNKSYSNTWSSGEITKLLERDKTQSSDIDLEQWRIRVAFGESAWSSSFRKTFGYKIDDLLLIINNLYNYLYNPKAFARTGAIGHVTEYTLLKLGNNRVIFPNSQAAKNIWKITNTTTPFDLKICSTLCLWALSLPSSSQFSSSFAKTVPIAKQIMFADIYPSIFSRQMEAIVYLFSKETIHSGRATEFQVKWWNISKINILKYRVFRLGLNLGWFFFLGHFSTCIACFYNIVMCFFSTAWELALGFISLFQFYLLFSVSYTYLNLQT